MNELKASERIAILEDIKARIIAGTYLPMAQVYVEFKNLPLFNEFDGGKEEASVVLPQVFRDGMTCEVCQIGALMLSTILVKDACKLQDVFDATEDGGTGAYRYLLKYFPAEQLALMETAFEKRYRGTDHLAFPYPREQEEKLDAAVWFGEQYDTDEERMEAIVDDMLLHGGEFRPEEAYAEAEEQAGYDEDPEENPGEAFEEEPL